MSNGGSSRLQARRLGIDTYREPVVFLRDDCPVCRAEGFQAMSRVEVASGNRRVIATLNVVHGDLVRPTEAGLSEAAWNALAATEGCALELSHPEPVESFSAVRSKIYGTPFTREGLGEVVHDISAGRYSSIELAAFVTSCAGEDMSIDETLALTQAMVAAGTRLAWPQSPVLDKHCVGGLPGNRTTPIVVAIVAAAGMTIPKTSSRAITSPAGTADTMEMLAPVDLTLQHMRRVVEREGGCVVWGGSMALSPADDMLIQVTRPLDFDSPGHLTASIISKKAAAGATHLVVDLPVGATAKVRSAAAAGSLGQRLTLVGREMGIHVEVLQTDGSQPVGRGIGPALEALDVLAVLRGEPQAPQDLRERAILLASRLLDLGGAGSGGGDALARQLLASGAAWKRFQAICEAQGGMRTPPVAPHRREVAATREGRIESIDNRRLSRVAKLAGAPLSPAAGVLLSARLGEAIRPGETLYTVHAQTAGELEYALAYARSHPAVIRIGEPP
ncbi:MAG TPA: thymidine phosphorylase family protein [Solimonas sp.]|nr:thymidine phosphorylase family protein [Solimonas sp.]